MASFSFKLALATRYHSLRDPKSLTFSAAIPARLRRRTKILASPVLPILSPSSGLAIAMSQCRRNNRSWGYFLPQRNVLLLRCLVPTRQVGYALGKFTYIFLGNRKPRSGQ